jgi:predicted dehydrogenase
MRVAVLGCGSIGRRHAANLRTLAVSEVLLYDPDLRARERSSAELGLEAFGDLNGVWDQRPDALVIASPSAQHIPLARAGAERGCHLFIEKPLSHQLDGIEALERLAEERGLVTMVGCNMRFHPGPATVKRLLDEGRIGSPIAARIYAGSYLPAWRPSQDYRQSYSASLASGGAILDVIHEIDLALWYMGPARLVAAAVLPANEIGLETDGLAELLLRHASGALSSVHLNFIQRDYRRGCQIIGTEGTLYWDFEADRVDVLRGEGVEPERHPLPSGWELNRMYLDELGHFLSCIESRAATVNPIGGGAAALEIALAARAEHAEAQV